MEKDFVLAWRLIRSKYGTKTEAFSGKGAANYPGRWNKPGIPVVYTCSSIALSALEVLVHAHDRRVINGRFTLFQVRIPAKLVTDPVLLNDLREMRATQEIGSQWVRKGTYPVLRVPSVITAEPNYILNPIHSDFSQIEIGDAQVFWFDQRLLPQNKMH